MPDQQPVDVPAPQEIGYVDPPIGAAVSTIPRPDITPAQVIAIIPVLATLLHAFGVYSLSAEQQDALAKTVDAAFVLIGGDAIIRLGRNIGLR